jgi:hypothetical protein
MTARIANKYSHKNRKGHTISRRVRRLIRRRGTERQRLFIGIKGTEILITGERRSGVADSAM